MTSPILTKAFKAAEDIAGCLIVKANDDGATVSPAKSGKDKILGAAGSLGAKAGAMLDVDQAGWSEARAGANVAFGDLLTSDAAARAVPAEPGDRRLGIAMADGAAGDIIPFRII